MGLSGEVRLEGRLFNMVRYDVITVLNEHYIMKFMRSTGLDRVMPQEGEDDTTYLLRLQADLRDTLQLPDLLAGYLLPAGKSETDWSLEMAKETAKFINGLTAREDRVEIQRLGMAICFDFFREGIASLKTSRNVSDPVAIPTKSLEQQSNAGH